MEQSFTDALAAALKRVADAHEAEQRATGPDPDWPGWYTERITASLGDDEAWYAEHMTNTLGENAGRLAPAIRAYLAE